MHDRESTRELKSALQALNTNFWGTPDPGLRPGLSEIGPSGLDRKHMRGTNQTHARTASSPNRFMGNDRGITRGLAIMASNRLPQSENSIFLGEMAWAIDRAEAQSTHGVGGVIRGS